MSHSTPLVEAGYLYDPAQPGARVPLDTPAWVAWLEQPTTTRFSYALFDPTRGYIVGYLTVRKEKRQRGGFYWIAYRRCDGRLRKVYLGRSSVVRQARLQVVAQTLRHCDERPS
jgi:LuxR family maltose regulon positive regulatory protein